MKLSAPQTRVLKRAQSSARPFRGHQLKTIESLANRGLVTYRARLECTRCGKYDCAQHQGSRWIIWADITPAGVSALQPQQRFPTVDKVARKLREDSTEGTPVYLGVQPDGTWEIAPARGEEGFWSLDHTPQPGATLRSLRETAWLMVIEAQEHFSIQTR